LFKGVLPRFAEAHLSACIVILFFFFFSLSGSCANDACGPRLERFDSATGLSVQSSLPLKCWRWQLAVKLE
jgi:hypothetical protein